MGIFDIFGDKRAGDDPATDYAYQGGWSVILIENLNAKRINARQGAKKKNKIQSPSVTFKAFIRTFKDSFNAGWQETQYPNQSVPIAHQSTPRRIIQIEWTVPSASKEEAVKNLAKCSWLAQSMFPALTWNDASGAGLPKSSFMAIKFANLIQANNGGPLPGYISNFNYTPNFVEGIHIIKEAEAGWANGYGQSRQYNLFPNVVDISLEFKPIQTRDSFGLDASEMEPGWNNSSWPYGIKIDPKLRTGDKATTKTSTQLADPRSAKIIKSQQSRITK